MESVTPVQILEEAVWFALQGFALSKSRKSLVIRPAMGKYWGRLDSLADVEIKAQSETSCNSLIKFLYICLQVNPKGKGYWIFLQAFFGLQRKGTVTEV